MRLTFLLLLSVAICLRGIKGQPAGPMPPGPAGGPGSTSTTSAVQCPAGNGVSTQVAVSGNKTTVTRTGCPPYSSYPAKNRSNATCQVGSTFVYYTHPIISSTVTWLSITFKNGSSNAMGGVKGTVGMSMTGVAVYADGDAENRDAYVYEGVSFDSCGGHSDQSGTYHYHAMPATGCAYNDTAGQHSPVFALMIDGIPLYGALGDKGVAPTDLDECGGHTDTTYAYYHYHLPNGLIPPYTARCLRGCLAKGLGTMRDQSNVTPTCVNDPTQYDYSNMTIPWVAGLAKELSPCNGTAGPGSMIVSAEPPAGSMTGPMPPQMAGGPMPPKMSGGPRPPGPGMMSAGNATAAAKTNCPAGYGVSTQVAVVNGKTKVTSTGCPPYSPFPSKTGHNASCQATKTFSVYASPVISSTVTWLSITFKNGSSNAMGGVKGTVGMSMTGVAVYADGDAENRDAYVYEGASFDSCGGHSDQSGTYHYHAMPATGCAYNDTAGQHSPVFALMIDGIPLYGALGDKGIAPTDLDECGGHTDATYAYYHYHLPNGLVSPYTVRCLRGCLAQAANGMGSANQAGTTPACVNATKQYDYSNMTIPWVMGLAKELSPCGNTSSKFDSTAATTATTVSMSLTMNGVDYNSVIGNATRTAELKTGVCSAAVSGVSSSGVDGVTCSVSALSAGSVVAQVDLTSSDSSTSSSLRTAANTFASNPAAYFPSSFVSEFGVTSFSAAVVPESSDESFPVAIVVGSVVGGVAALAILVGAVVLIAKRSGTGTQVVIHPDSQSLQPNDNQKRPDSNSPIKSSQVAPSPKDGQKPDVLAATEV